MGERITRTRLLGLIHAEHARLETTLAQLTEAQMARAGVMGEWSVKDILAHLTFWEQRMLKMLQTGRPDDRPEYLPAEGEEWPAAMDRINEQAFVANRRRPLAEVLADYRCSFRQVLDVVESLADDDLAGAGRLEREIGRPVQPLIAGNTYEHYQEHADAIRAWLDGGAAAQAADGQSRG